MEPVVKNPSPAPVNVDPMLPGRWRIKEVHRETADTFTMALTPENPSQRLHFHAGQFNMLYVFGVGEVPISISGNPVEPESLIHTVRSVGTVTRAMSKMHEGDMLGVRGPFGSSWPVAEARGRDVLLAAGGIGLAPLRSALLKMLSRRADYGRIVLLYGARTPEDLLYLDELEDWKRNGGVDVLVTVDRAASHWQGNVGVVTTLITNATFNPANTMAFLCGPEVMMRFTAMELEKRGVSPRRLFVSMERNMKCAVGFCGHCQYGPAFICRDGPVFPLEQIKRWLNVREL